MARVNVETRAMSDSGFWKLMGCLKWGRRETMGLLVLLWAGTQELLQRHATKEDILFHIDYDDDEEGERIFNALVKCKYLRDLGKGLYHIRGNDKHVEANEKLRSSASKAGLASGEARRRKAEEKARQQEEAAKNLDPVVEPVAQEDTISEPVVESTQIERFEPIERNERTVQSVQTEVEPFIESTNESCLVEVESTVESSIVVDSIDSQTNGIERRSNDVEENINDFIEIERSANGIERNVNGTPTSIEPNTIQFNTIQSRTTKKNTSASNDEKEDQSTRVEITPRGGGVISELSGNPTVEFWLVQITKETQRAWLETYRSPEWIQHEILRGNAWIKANAHKAPKKAFGRFFGGWLGRAFDSQRKNIQSNGNGINRAQEKINVIKSQAQRVMGDEL